MIAVGERSIIENIENSIKELEAANTGGDLGEIEKKVAALISKLKSAGQDQMEAVIDRQVLIEDNLKKIVEPVDSGLKQAGDAAIAKARDDAAIAKARDDAARGESARSSDQLVLALKDIGEKLERIAAVVEKVNSAPAEEAQPHGKIAKQAHAGQHIRRSQSSDRKSDRPRRK